MITTKPLYGDFGAEISGVDLSRPLNDDDIGAIMAALHEHQVIVVREQTLTPEQFNRYGRHFGTPMQHVLDHKRLPGHPDILLLTNIFENGEPVGIYDGAAFWHTDQSYDADPASATILYSIQAPREGGETMIADMFRAYDTLSPSMQDRIADLRAFHYYTAGGDDGELANDAQRAAVPAVSHPLVRPHPVTGRKALYAVTGSVRGIEGMPADEAQNLLAELRAHALQDALVHRHKYAAGDVIAWDTASTLHSATHIAPATGPDDTRLLHRISVKGRPAVLH